MSRAIAIAALSLAGALALASAAFATAHALDPVFAIDLRIALWLSEAAHWSVGAALFLLAARRLANRPADARAASVVGAIVVTLASFNAQSVPFALTLAATVACALAPWSAIAFPPSPARLLVTAGNLALVAAAPAIGALAQLPWWLRTLAPIDPLRIPAWLHDRPLQWPWIVAAAPVVFGVPFNEPRTCCVAIPVNSPLLVVVPAAILGLAIWYGGRTRPHVPVGRRGPAGSAMRRG